MSNDVTECSVVLLNILKIYYESLFNESKIHVNFYRTVNQNSYFRAWHSSTIDNKRMRINKNLSFRRHVIRTNEIFRKDDKVKGASEITLRQ